MTPPSEPPVVAHVSTGPRQWIRINPVPCQHVQASRGLILEASAAVRPGQAIVLGAGPCREIPLRELADRFARVVLNDHDAGLLSGAIASAGLDGPQSSRVETLAVDLTGVTSAFLGRVAECLETSDDLTATAAVERIARLADEVRPAAFATCERYDLVVASGVLCQLHLEACNRSIALFAARYPGREQEFRQSPAWTRALYGLARRMEDVFIETLHGLLAPGGRIYLADSVQSCFVHPTPEGDWLTDGTYRMTRTTRLADYLDGRFRIEREGRWFWVVAPAPENGMVGRLFNTQGLVLSVSGDSAGSVAVPIS